jgi:hypothetical protein
MRFTLCEKSLSVDEAVDISSEFDGGVPGLYSALWTETIRTTLRRGGRTAVMKITDIAAAARSPRFLKLAQIAKSIKDGNSSGRYRAGSGNLDSQISGIPVPSGHHRPHETGAGHEQTTPS